MLLRDTLGCGLSPSYISPSLSRHVVLAIYGAYIQSHQHRWPSRDGPADANRRVASSASFSFWKEVERTLPDEPSRRYRIHIAEGSTRMASAVAGPSRPTAPTRSLSDTIPVDVYEMGSGGQAAGRGGPPETQEAIQGRVSRLRAPDEAKADRRACRCPCMCASSTVGRGTSRLELS